MTTTARALTPQQPADVQKNYGRNPAPAQKVAADDTLNPATPTPKSPGVVNGAAASTKASNANPSGENDRTR
jgi:hypothetical protein